MKLHRFFRFIILPAVLVIGFQSGAFAQVAVTLEPSAQNAQIGNEFMLKVNVDDATLADGTSLAGAAFTINYDAAKVEVVGGNGEFGAGDNFDQNDAFNESVSDTQGSIFPIVGNDVVADGMVMMSGAYIDPATGEGAYDGAQTLFTIKFRVKDTAVDGEVANFTLARTTLTNTAAGWNGEQVPPLVGVNPDWDLTPDVSDDFVDMAATLPTTASVVNISSVGGPASGDPDSDGDTDVFDLITAIDKFGPVGADPVANAVDMDQDGDVDLFDLIAMIDLM